MRSTAEKEDEIPSLNASCMVGDIHSSPKLMRPCKRGCEVEQAPRGSARPTKAKTSRDLEQASFTSAESSRNKPAVCKGPPPRRSPRLVAGRWPYEEFGERTGLFCSSPPPFSHAVIGTFDARRRSAQGQKSPAPKPKPKRRTPETLTDGKVKAAATPPAQWRRVTAGGSQLPLSFVDEEPELSLKLSGCETE